MRARADLSAGSAADILSCDFVYSHDATPDSSGASAAHDAAVIPGRPSAG